MEVGVAPFSHCYPSQCSLNSHIVLSSSDTDFFEHVTEFLKIRQGSWLWKLQPCLYFNVPLRACLYRGGRGRGRHTGEKLAAWQLSSKSQLLRLSLCPWKFVGPSHPPPGSPVLYREACVRSAAMRAQGQSMDTRPALAPPVPTASPSNIQDDKWHPEPGTLHPSLFKAHPSSARVCASCGARSPGTHGHPSPPGAPGPPSAPGGGGAPRPRKGSREGNEDHGVREGVRG